ncbi:helix-turn-helix domain-containing protein [Photobacterium sp. DNB23_23_1]|uniref:AraC family transcriptional regulator n=1 Tax=Photobacterium pectinilyticum TaxID=2906793 RepID=A0ABT1N0B2_9GAMM|nr:AraC family transcriptional regulator [Photobacterium sp. ZSDE20]MCQ1058176.1 AraC family transcriptional regulator [Photobacterium sp. ZSDE20]MDD1822900.1 AraC family transcriptional regulator [Photobacterium sp. ZSDE20]
MCQRVIANTPKFLLFDLQSALETKHLLFCADYVLVWPRNSGCTLYLGTSSHNIAPGQLALLAPFSPHRFEFESTNKGGVETQCDVLHFRLNALGQTFIDSVQFSAIKQMLDKARSGYLFDVAADSNVNKYLQVINNSYDFSQVLNLLHLLEVLSTQTRNCLTDCDYDVVDSQRIENKVRIVLKYIEENLGEPLSVTMVANQLHMADSTFSRFFHANLGVTFRQYLIEQRVRQAVRYLITTDWTIAQIGAEVGFSSLSNFNAKFKNIIRVTPREYRASHLNKQHYHANYRSVVGQLQNQLV